MHPFASLGRFAVRFRWVVLVVWLVGAPVAASTLPALSSVAKNDNSAFLPADAPSEHAASLAVPFQPRKKGTALVVAVRGDGPLTAADQAVIQGAEAVVARVPVVLAVKDQGASSDGRAEKIGLELDVPPFGGGDKATTAIDAVRHALDSVPSPAGLAFHLAGNIPTFVDEERSTQHTQKLTQRLAILFIVALLLVVFRALLAPFVTLVPAVLALAVSEPIIAEATHIGVQVSNLLELLLVVIVLGAGTDYGLFLIFRMREEMRAGRAPRDAVVVSVTRVGESITFSAATVIAALVSLLLASFGLYRGLGPGLAIGVGMVLLANLTLLPALLAIVGKAVYWPFVPTAGQQRRTVWGSVAARIVARPAPTLAIGVAVFGALALVMLDYSPAGFGGAAVPATSDSAQGKAALSAHFASAEANPTDAVFRLPVSAWERPEALASAERALRASGLFATVAGPLDPNGRTAAFTPAQLGRLHAALGAPQALPLQPPPQGPSSAVPAPVYRAYLATAQFVSADGRTLLFATSLNAGGPETPAALNAVPAVRGAVAAVAARIGAVDSGVAGLAPTLNDVASVSAHDLVKIIPVVLAVLALLLALVLRSLVAPLYLVLSVGLSYLAALGLAVLVFVVIGGQAGINFVLPFFMFIFIMALGEDYNILVMSRIREEAHGLALRAAVQRAVQATGTTVTSAGLILAGTFAVLTASGGTQIREIGFGLAAGVLLDTFLVRTLLVPSTVVLLGRWNWWPSRLWRDERGGGAPTAEVQARGSA